MEDYLISLATNSPRSISFSANRVISGYCNYRDKEAVLLHKDKVDAPTPDQVWVAWSQHQRENSNNYHSSSFTRSACYVCGEKLSEAFTSTEGTTYPSRRKCWTIRQVVPFLERRKLSISMP